MAERIHTFCAMCTSRCGVVATVEDGKLAKVERDPEHPNGCICVKGAAAAEIVYSPDRIREPMLRTRPKGDADPGWKPVSWEEAMQKMAGRLHEIRETDGAEAVVFGRATPAGSGTAEFDAWLQRLGNAFGSPNLLATTHICNWHRVYGSKYTFGVATPTADYAHTGCILLWGNNPQATAPDAAMRISRARARGAKLIVIDPRGNDLAKKADCWLRVRPGGDAALALAMIHVLFEENLYDQAFVRDWTNGPFLVRGDTGALLAAEPGEYMVWDEIRGAPAACSEPDIRPALTGSYSVRLGDGGTVECRPALDLLKDTAGQFAPERSSEITWVAADEVRRAVRMFVAEKPSCYATWVGLEQHADAMQTNRAVCCFYGLTGQFDRRGSNVMFAATPARPMMGRDLLPKETAARRLGLDRHPLGPPRDPGIVQADKFYEAILNGRPYPVKAALLFGGDMLMNAGDAARGAEALEALDFYVHMDIFANNSAAHADLLLPACTPWEYEAAKAFFAGSAEGGAWSQLRKAVVAPQHVARTDMEVLFDLAVRLGLGEHFFGGQIESAWNAHLEPAGLTLEELRAQPAGLRSEARTSYQKYAQTDAATGRPKGFQTASGKLELYSIAFADAGYPPLPEYSGPAEGLLADPEMEQPFPLALTFFRQIQFVDQQHRNIPRLRRQVPEPSIELHPSTAERFGIAPGDRVVVETAAGSVRLKAKFNASLHPRVVCTPYGWWQQCRELDLPGYDALSPEGANLNLIIPNSGADAISSAVPHRSQSCRVRKDVAAGG
ncbi:MAG: molybdopterin-dependent oxidoreductase [Rhodospirillales bacterium]|jgi:anaerobic selenocysteine-containing dehydrogenase|nr:molybdopterin-dependent oxidoreductase [Rhodospirillales bacterium]MDP6646424.1 molybdopterin-dependent oxidoreductase [Rhodospirillales bacterium]MDP6841062.1 molybdopterin-dependent oxidoreductase [Rhodospirillales bacterium]